MRLSPPDGGAVQRWRVGLSNRLIKSGVELSLGQAYRDAGRTILAGRFLQIALQLPTQLEESRQLSCGVCAMGTKSL